MKSLSVIGVMCVMILLLVLLGCSKQVDTEDKSDDDAAVESNNAPEFEVDQSQEKCKDQCYKVSTWCDRDQLYACVQEPGCMKQFLVKACDDESTCENSIFCRRDDGSREGVMTMDQLMQAAPSVKGEAGDEFNLEYLGSKMDCVVTEIIRGTAVILCE